MSKILSLYIQDDNVEKLWVLENKAGLINSLLREHFRKLDPKNMTPEEIRTEIAKRKIEKEFKLKMEKLNG